MKMKLTNHIPHPDSGQTLLEEVVNAVTHGIGALLAVAGLTALVILAVLYGDVWHIVGVSIYGGTLVFLYLASTLYHAIQHRMTKHVFHVLDHVGIALLIAGTYTPILLIKMRDTQGWIYFVLIWTLALVAAGFKGFFVNRFTKLSALIYAGMGWLSVPMLGSIFSALGAAGFVWLAAGGLSYTLGIIPFLWTKLPFNHAIWHLFVLAGSVCHYVVIARFVLPWQG
jgi:hemolysin III